MTAIETELVYSGCDGSVNDRTIYWHDYETFGADARRDRPAQFAGLRTNEDLEIVGEPHVVYCKPGDDFLPHPEACLITGITPQLALEKGICEAEFIASIHSELARPGTCGAGYNSIRFDDEITRHCLYRNFYDAYAREWQNGNSRWDIIDMVRLTRALRPDGIDWPIGENGEPSFKLENICQANQLEHASAHDALSDVRATIELARLIKKRQPKLYAYIFNQRFKKQVLQLIIPGGFNPVLHVSGRFPAKTGCIAVVVPLAWHPTNKNQIIVYDLSKDPEPLSQLHENDIKKILFTASENLPEGVVRIGLKGIQVNKCPVVVPLTTMRPQDADRLQIDLALCMRHLDLIKTIADLNSKLAVVFGAHPDKTHDDPDLMLYSGGFFNDHDKRQMVKIRQAKPTELGHLHLEFHDRRMTEMFFRYKARNYPQTLNQNEARNWERYRCARLLDSNATIQLKAYREIVSSIRKTAKLDIRQSNILDQLELWADKVTTSCGNFATC